MNGYDVRDGWSHVPCRGSKLISKFDQLGAAIFECDMCGHRWARLWVEGLTESLATFFAPPDTGPVYRLVERTNGRQTWTETERVR